MPGGRAPLLKHAAVAERVMNAQQMEWAIGPRAVAMHAREERGALEWACRTIDLDRKYLPATCRE